MRREWIFGFLLGYAAMVRWLETGGGRAWEFPVERVVDPQRLLPPAAISEPLEEEDEDGDEDADEEWEVVFLPDMAFCYEAGVEVYCVCCDAPLFLRSDGASWCMECDLGWDADGESL